MLILERSNLSSSLPVAGSLVSTNPTCRPDGFGVVRRWQSWMSVAVWGCPQRAEVWDGWVWMGVVLIYGCDGCDEYNIQNLKYIQSIYKL